MILYTQRLILRPFTIEDIDAIYDIFKDKEANSYLPWFPLKSKEEALVFFKNHYLKETGYHYAACLKEDNIPIGYISINTEDKSNDLGFGMKKEYWHKGYTSEAVAKAISQAQKDGLEYLTATHDINNLKSGNVMKNVGMKYCYSYEEPNNNVIFRMYQINLRCDLQFVYKGYWRRFPNHFIEADI